MNPLITTRFRHAKRGFALIVTLSLIILLTVIAVGLLTLSSVTLRSSAQGEAGAVARANASPLPGAVVLGSLKTRIKPGERMTIKPEPDANGMYRMMVAYADETKELIPCYDRYVSSNHEARDILLLLPDATLGLKVFSQSEFGPFD